MRTKKVNSGENQDGGVMSSRGTASRRVAIQMLVYSNMRKTRRREAGPLYLGRISGMN